MVSVALNWELYFARAAEQERLLYWAALKTMGTGVKQAVLSEAPPEAVICPVGQLLQPIEPVPL